MSPQSPRVSRLQSHDDFNAIISFGRIRVHAFTILELIGKFVIGDPGRVAVVKIYEDPESTSRLEDMERDWLLA